MSRRFGRDDAQHTELQAEVSPNSQRLSKESKVPMVTKAQQPLLDRNPDFKGVSHETDNCLLHRHRFDCKSDVSVQMQLTGHPVALNFDAICLYVKGVGRVKSVTTANDATEEVDLTSHHIP